MSRLILSKILGNTCAESNKDRRRDHFGSRNMGISLRFGKQAMIACTTASGDESEIHTPTPSRLAKPEELLPSGAQMKIGSPLAR